MEWKESSDEDIEDDTTRPEINIGAVATLFSDDFGCHASRGSTRGLEQTVLFQVLGESTETKVGGFKVATFVEKKIFGLKVTVVVSRVYDEPFLVTAID
ncbi:hypothetical protein CsatB_001605 [Cannabis sativa]